MSDLIVERGEQRLFTRADGPVDGPPVVFAHALGTDLTLWDRIIPLLPPKLRLIRYDLRGHGRSCAPPAPYTMGQLVADAEAVCDAHHVSDAVFVGLSVGGLVAQGLAVKRLDLIRALVLSNTAARIGTPKLWDDRIATVRAQGLDALADNITARWFGRDFRDTSYAALLRTKLIATSVEGYVGTCAAIAGTDFYTTTASLRLPALGIAGSEDGSTPADLIRETVDLIPGSQFKLIRRTGHLPCVEDPIAYAEALTAFLERIGHLASLPGALPPHMGNG